MTFQDEAVEVRRTSVGAKVLIFACGILAVLGSFWSIVWFIRAYVEAPRVGIPPALAMAARDTPVVPSAPTTAPVALLGTDTKPAGAMSTSSAAIPQPAPDNVPKAARDVETTASISDRWLPGESAPAPEPAPAQAAATDSTPAAESEPAADEVVESSVPLISGPAPLPRRKPSQTALVKRAEPPMPRPRPDGPAPQSVWTAVPVSDDRFPSQ